MTDQGPEHGYEFVLDNRKLIVAFAVLIVVCGCFFVVGFVEGKRQGNQERSQAVAESSATVSPERLQAPVPPPEDNPGELSLKENSEEQRLDWYKSVNGRENTPGIEPQKTTSDAANRIMEPSPSTETAGRLKPQPSATHAGPVTYSVQVGAFRQQREVEIKAQMVRSKGYECRIEPPRSPGQFYLLKVGKFGSRAEAVAMQIRLRKSGFTSAFIKTN
jgi:cell division protein FtsN